MASHAHSTPAAARSGTLRGLFRLVAVAFAALSLPAAADDTALLIQLQPDGRYQVWHAGGQPPLSDDELLALEASATPEGGRNVVTSAGLARAYDTSYGVLIRLPALGPDRALLLDRDGCGGIKVWQSQGTVHPTEDELTELVLTALPEGGKPVTLGKLRAKAYSTKFGVIAVIWRPTPKRPGSRPPN
ncbi:MAG: hypothetical protein K8F32_00050 [Rhodocyclaceae bacterium]|nr:hypothetical protein [Rhodocyclaceae bacterium]